MRKEPPLKELHKYRNLVGKLDCVRIPVLGTDAAIGKRTTAIVLSKALNERGILTSFIATGQTGLMQGSRYGIPLDAIRGDYVVGELEHAIVTAYREENPRAIIIEGQGALSHPAYVTGSRAIVSASEPQAVVLQHAPGRKYRSYTDDVPHLPMSTIGRETELVRACAGCDVIAITLNPEGLTRDEVVRIASEYEERYGVPVCDVLADGPGKIVDAIVSRFFSETA
ncbi:MAG: NAD-dependent epimerase/dehydratase family protein [Methanobacteriota archaeon]|nr:MAG: NAD-dependent epimerase/dehydratase family protein [Euryarchaeota archaeon]